MIDLFKARMQVQLTAVSPVVFMLAREGDRALIKRTPPKPREYRGKIGPATEALLVFKGDTKIGMIPHDIIRELGDVPIKSVCRIAKMDSSRTEVVIQIYPREIAASHSMSQESG